MSWTEGWQRPRRHDLNNKIPGFDGELKYAAGAWENAVYKITLDETLNGTLREGMKISLEEYRDCPEQKFLYDGSYIRSMVDPKMVLDLKGTSLEVPPENGFLKSQVVYSGNSLKNNLKKHEFHFFKAKKLTAQKT